MNTRNGKIARLPKSIREELNRRLEDGQPGPQLLEWLNSLPEVQSVLETHFNAQPISESNLSHWRTGGHADWLRHQQAQEQLHLLIERSCDLEAEEADGLICDRIARLATIELARQIQELEAIEDPEKRWQKFQELSRELCRFQNGAHYARYAQITWERWQWERQGNEVARADKLADQKLMLTFLQSLTRSSRRQTKNPPKTDDLNQIEPN